MNHFEIYLDQKNNEWLCIPYNLLYNLEYIIFEEFKFQKFNEYTGTGTSVCSYVAVNKNMKWENFDNSAGNHCTYERLVQLTGTGKKVKNLSEFLGTVGISEKYFIVHKESRTLYCAQNGKIVKYANEYDKRPFVVSNIVYTPDAFQKIDIDYQTYLILTGLKEKTKKTELAEIKAKIISENTLGCQFEVLKPIVEDLISLIHKIDGLKKFHKEVIGAIISTFANYGDDKNFTCTETYRYDVVKDLLKEYVKKLKEN